MSDDDWRPTEEAPKDGTVIIGAEFYRWLPYKRGAPKALRALGGRWQRHNGYGWENCEAPGLWKPVPKLAEDKIP
jgi:hypothetical protein